MPTIPAPGCGPPAVFAYGTLRPGSSGYLSVAGFRHTAQRAWLSGWAVAVHDQSGNPTIVPEPEGFVIGDLLRFDPADWPTVLERLDRLEAHPWLYERQMYEVRVVDDEGQQTNEAAWVYGPGRTSIPAPTRVVALADYR